LLIYPVGLGLEELLRPRSHILETELQVLAAELPERFDLRDRNLAKVEAARRQIIETMPQWQPSLRLAYLLSRRPEAR
jgi:hypothetical protein